jgi:hypothetical protein
MDLLRSELLRCRELKKLAASEKIEQVLMPQRQRENL